MHSTMLRRVSRDSYEGGHGTESSDKSSSEVSVPGALSCPQRGSRGVDDLDVARVGRTRDSDDGEALAPSRKH